MADLHLATIEALALAIDAKDQTTQSHIRRVQVYAAGLAQQFGMSDKEIQGVKTAALLHDIGKLAVPEHILSKPGPLTHEEFQKIRGTSTVAKKLAILAKRLPPSVDRPVTISADLLVDPTIIQ